MNTIGDVDLGANRTARWITAGDYVTCAVLDNDKIKCWGRGLWGALAQGNTKRYGTVATADSSNEPMSALAELPWVVMSTCDASTAPRNGTVGDCTVALAGNSTCQPTCDTGYTVSGASSCMTPPMLAAATCLPISCDASTAPVNGNVGNCTNLLLSGTTCEPTCDEGTTLVGVTACTAGVLTSNGTCTLSKCRLDGNPVDYANVEPSTDWRGNCSEYYSIHHGMACQFKCEKGFEIGVSICNFTHMTLSACVPSPSSGSGDSALLGDNVTEATRESTEAAGSEDTGTTTAEASTEDSHATSTATSTLLSFACVALTSFGFAAFLAVG